MNLLNDLGNDLAQVFFIEKKYWQKLDTAQARRLIDEIRAVLLRTHRTDTSVNTGQSVATKAMPVSH